MSVVGVVGAGRGGGFEGVSRGRMMYGCRQVGSWWWG